MIIRPMALLLLASLLLAACSAPAKNPAPINGTNPPPAQSEKPAQPEKPAEAPSQPAASAFERVQVKAGEPLPGVGIYLVDIATGAADGWRPLSQQPHLRYTVSDDNRFIGVRAEGETFLIDRRSGKVSAQVGELLDARAGRTLLVEPEKGSISNRYVVLNEEQTEVARFKLPGWGASAQGLLSPDGKKALVSTYTPQQQTAFLYLADVTTGEVEELATMTASQDLELFSAGLTPIPGARETLYTLTNHRKGGRGELGFSTLVRRFDWQGKLLLEKAGDGRAGDLSPDGAYLLWHSEVAGYPGAVGPADLRDGSALFRAKVFTLTSPWIADGSGFLVNDRGTWKKVTLAGKVEPLAVCERFDCQPGVTPAPDDPNLFLLGARRVVSRDGKVDLQITPPPNQFRIRSGVDPWGASSKEVRLVVEERMGGGGWDGYAWALPLQIERPPFDDRLVVKGTGDCLNLREGYQLSARVITCLPDGTVLKVVQPAPSPDKTSLLWGDGGQWAYVRTEKGEQGWVSLGSGYVGWLK